MKCAGFSHTPVLVELHQVGIVGLRKALSRIDESGLDDREKILDKLIELLSGDNYFPQDKMDAYRITLWREYLRFKGEDFSEFYSAAQITVRGNEGPERDEFLDIIQSVFAHYELKPVILFRPPGEPGPNPQLLIDGKVIVRGLLTKNQVKNAVRRSFSDW